MWQMALFSLLSKFSLCLWLSSLILKCLDVGLFRFVLCGIHWASWIWTAISFLKFEKSPTIISSHRLSDPFPFSFTSSTPLVCALSHSVMSHKPPGLSFSPFSSLFFLLLLMQNFKWLVFRFADSFLYIFKSGVESLWWIFQFNYCVLQLLNF